MILFDAHNRNESIEIQKYLDIANNKDIYCVHDIWNLSLVAKEHGKAKWGPTDWLTYVNQMCIC